MPGVNKVDRIRQQIEVGVPVGDAIRFALGGSIPKWAERRDLSRVAASMTIYSKRLPPQPDVLAALVKDLGATEDDVRELLAEGARAVALAS